MMYFNDSDVKLIKDEINNSSSIIIITHEFPDGDAVGSLIACDYILKEYSDNTSVYCYVNSDIPEQYDFIASDFKVISKERLSSSKFDLAIVLDCGNIDRTGIKDIIEDMQILNIDHHGDNTKFGKYNFVFPESSSTAEILFYLAERIIAVPLKREIARSLYTAIVTDTGGFRFPCTSASTHYAASILYKTQDADLDQVISKIYFEEPYNKIKLLGEILSNMKIDNGICYSAITADIWEKTQTNPKMVEGLVNFMASISEAKVAALFQELPDKVKASLRSRGDIDCRKIAHNFGGGGHTQAAGARFTQSLDDAIESFLNYVKEYVL